MNSLRYYITLGPACQQSDLLCEMFQTGITGVRLNLSYGSLSQRQEELCILREAACKAGCSPELLIDLQGPELRIGALPEPIVLKQGDSLLLGEKGVPVPPHLLEFLEPGDTLLLDDGRLLLKALLPSANSCSCQILRGGLLQPRKSIAIQGKEIPSPVLTKEVTSLVEVCSPGKGCAEGQAHGVVVEVVDLPDDHSAGAVDDRDGGDVYKRQILLMLWCPPLRRHRPRRPAP